MIESLNTECLCPSLDRADLQRALEADPAARGLHEVIQERCPHLFAAMPVFAAPDADCGTGSDASAAARSSPTSCTPWVMLSTAKGSSSWLWTEEEGVFIHSTSAR